MSWSLDLAQVVMKMVDVVAHEIVEGRRRRGWHRLPRQFVEIVLAALAQSNLVRHRGHEPRDVQIIGAPECQRWWLLAAESIRCPMTSFGDHLPGPGRRAADSSDMVTSDAAAAMTVAARSSA